MRVLHVIPSISAAHGGPSRAIRLIEQALREQGIAVDTATTDDPPGHARPRGPEAGTYSFRRDVGAYKVSVSLARWLFAHAGDYDLVHIHALFSFSSTIAAWAARRAGVPYVIRPLGTLAPYGMTRRRPWLKRLSLLLVEGPILRRAAAVHFTSVMERDEAVALGLRLRQAVIPLAVLPLPAVGPGELDSRFPQLRGRSWVLFLSRLAPKKNVEALLRAVATCRMEFPEQRWLIAGDGDPAYVASLHALATDLGVADVVVWAGHLEGAEKSAALSGADLYVLPSYSENFGIAAAEALIAGLPLVLGKGVALAGLVEQNGAGRSVEPVPEAIAAAMVAYLRDPAGRANAGVNAARLATREFSITSMGTRLGRLYETILAAQDSNQPDSSRHG